MKDINDIKGKTGIIGVIFPSRIKKHAGSSVMSGLFHTFVQSVLNYKFLRFEYYPNPILLKLV